MHRFSAFNKLKPLYLVYTNVSLRLHLPSIVLTIQLRAQRPDASSKKLYMQTVTCLPRDMIEDWRQGATVSLPPIS
jgi:hypothetical protein